MCRSGFRPKLGRFACAVVGRDRSHRPTAHAGAGGLCGRAHTHPHHRPHGAESGRPAARPDHVDALELDDQRVVRAPGDVIEGRRGRPDLAEQLALGDPGQPLAGALQSLGADVDRVVQLQVDDRDDGRIGHALGEEPLSFLDGVPALGVAGADESADLDEVERQLRLAEIGPDRRDEVGEDVGIFLRGLAAGVALALVPEHALDLATGELELPHHRAIEALPALILLGRVPLLHARPAVGADDQADRDPGLLDHGLGEGQTQAGSLAAALVGLRRPLLAGLGVARVDRVGRVDQPVERLLGLASTCRPCRAS